MRLYRATLPIAILAMLVVLFAVVSRPEPLQPETSLEPFDEAAAVGDARRLLEVAPERVPGSADADVAADFVAGELEGMERGDVEEDRFEAGVDGETVELVNLVYDLPGETDEVILIAAPRDCASGTCAGTSAASTGALLELARGFSRSHHEKTVMLASTGGSSLGAAGTKRLAERLSDVEVTAAIVVSAAGITELGPRLVVPWSTTTRATSLQLLLSAEESVRVEMPDREPPSPGTLPSLVRLAIPAGLGEQAPLVGAGFDAVGISGAGSEPVSRSRAEELSAETLGAIGRTTLSLARAVDSGPASLEGGPRARVPLAGKLVPGWALSLLAVALLVPLAAAAVEGTARALRAGAPLGAAVSWVASRAAPFLGAFLALMLLGLIRILPAPPFPFDAGMHALDLGAVLALGLAVAIATAGLAAIERVRPQPVSEAALAAGLAAALLASGVAVWAMNPYLALALSPALHIWLLASSPDMPGGRAGRVVLVALGLGTVVAIGAELGSQLGVGLASVPWQLILLYTGGHFHLLTALPPILLAGTVVALGQARIGTWTDMRVRHAQGSRPRRPIKPPIEHGEQPGKTR